ncbi:MAG: FG-GAP-like repeat-containing protein, partial [Bacteroidota bacterium]
MGSWNNYRLLCLLLSGMIVPQLIFAQLPFISGLNPAAAYPGDTILIQGTNLPGQTFHAVVYIGDKKAQVLNANPTSLEVVVPAGVRDSRIQLTNTNTGLQAQSDDFVALLRCGGDIGLSSFLPATVLAGLGPVEDIWARDQNDDNLPELIVAVSNPPSINVFVNQHKPPGIVASDFVSGGSYPLSQRLHQLEFADLNGDGQEEWVLLYEDKIELLDANALNLQQTLSFPATVGATDLSIVDWDSDGWLDIMVWDSTNQQLLAFENSLTGPQGSVGFNAPSSIVLAKSGSNLSGYDLNQDTKPELILAGLGEDSLFIVPNLSTTSGISVADFGTPIGIGSGLQTAVPEIADLDQDGVAEIVLANNSPELRIYSTPAGLLAYNAINLSLGDPLGQIEAHDLNGDGLLDISGTNQDSSLALLS